VADPVAGLLARAERERRLPPLVTVSGDEPLLTLEAADAIRAAARRHGYSEREVLNADARFDWSRLAQAGSALSLFAERRIVELRLPGGKPGTAGGAALEALAQQPPDDTLVLITLPRLDKRTRESRWAAALARQGAWIELPAVERAALPAWIGTRLAKQGQSADAEALEFIAERVEGNLLAAHQEIAKLALLHPPGALTLAQVHEAVLDVARYDVFALPAAIAAGDAARVAKTLAGLRAEGAALPLAVWAIAEEARALLGVKAQTAAGQPLAQALREHRVWGPREAAFTRALRRVSMSALEQALARLADVDRLAKGLRAPRLDSDPWLELTGIALGIARGDAH
jgi:DNA polymerase-3 subunit delta